MITFSEIECNKIIDLSNTLEKNIRDGLKTNLDRPSENISYNFYNIVRNDDTQWIFDRFNLYLQKNDNLKTVKDLDVIHMHEYNVGNKFTKHRDIYYEGQYFNVGVCLNDNFEGGDFKLYNPEKTINKKTGNIYSFKNTRLHEVTEITKGVRWALIGFYFEDNFEKVVNNICIILFIL